MLAHLFYSPSHFVCDLLDSMIQISIPEEILSSKQRRTLTAEINSDGEGHATVRVYTGRVGAYRSIKEVAEAIGRSPRWIHDHLISTGLLKKLPDGYPLEDVEKALEACAALKS